MFSFFGGSSSYDKKDKKSKKKKGTKDKQEVVKQFVNPLKNIVMNAFSKMGYGGKKSECQDSFCMIEKFADECYFFAVYDGHGSSGKESSQAANDYKENLQFFIGFEFLTFKLLWSRMLKK